MAAFFPGPASQQPGSRPRLTWEQDHTTDPGPVRTGQAARHHLAFLYNAIFLNPILSLRNEILISEKHDKLQSKTPIKMKVKRGRQAVNNLGSGNKERNFTVHCPAPPMLLFYLLFSGLLFQGWPTSGQSHSLQPLPYLVSSIPLSTKIRTRTIVPCLIPSNEGLEDIKMISES